MAEWVLIENNQIIEYHDLLPVNWKNVSGLRLSANDLPYLKTLGWYKVTKQPESFNSDTHQLTGYNFVIHDDYVEQIPNIVAYTPNELQNNKESKFNSFMSQLRLHRNQKLLETDFTQLLDVFNRLSEIDKQNITNYRQSLRDFPGQFTIDNYENLPVIWPENVAITLN